MRSCRKSTMSVILVVVLGAGPAALADMGSVWVESVGPDSITINWSDPEGIHFLADDLHRYRVSWELVNTYGGRSDFPNPSSDSVELFSEDSKPYTITGLESGDAWGGEGGHYRIKVETFAGKLDPYGNPVASTYRLAGMVRQKTLWAKADREEPTHHNLRLARTTGGSITVELANLPAGYDKVRFAYKQKWQAKEAVDLIAVAGTALGPADTWVQSDELRGWEDLFPADVISATFSGLTPAQGYEIIAFGFKIGIQDGTYLGRVTGRTAGFRSLASRAAVIASNYQDLLYDYILWCAGLHGYERALYLVAEHVRSLTSLPDPCPEPPELCESERDFVLRDDGDDLAGDLTLVLYLIEARHEEFEEWQMAEAEEMPQGSLDYYLYKYRSWLIPDIDADIDPTPISFLRGDVDPNGKMDISDPIAILYFLFVGGASISCMDAADVSDDGIVDISDPIRSLAVLYLGGEAIPAPIGSCGPDPTAEDPLDCEEFSSCP